ncbi:LCP family protein [Slackia piriformis]|nr:LCP family protein [Slackia piriformis]
MARTPRGKHGGNHSAPLQNTPGSYGQTPSSGASNNPYSRANAHYSAKTGGRTVTPVVPAGSDASAYSRANVNYSSKKRGMSRGKKIAVGIVCVLLVCLVGAGVAGAWYLGKIDETLSGGLSEEQRNAIAEVTDPNANFDKPFYMLLIGSDARADDPSGGQRSDTNILVYVDPVENIVSMVSIPRDTMIEINGNMEKFNAAYSYRGAASTIMEANELCGVKISHYAEVNFEKLVQLIDAVGGVEVDVPELIDDPDAGDVVIEEGLQTLDGEAALTFARSRAYADGDFTRTSNQRLLVEALINKVLQTPVNELPGVIQSAAECVTTDLTATEIIDLAMRFQDGGLTMYSAMVPSTTAMVGGVSYVLTYQPLLDEMMELIEAGKDPSTVEAIGTQEDIREEQQELMGTSGSTVYYDDPTVYADSYGSSYDYSGYVTGPSGNGTGGYDGSYGGNGYAGESGMADPYGGNTGYGYDQGYAGDATGGGNGYDPSADAGYGAGAGTGADTGAEAYPQADGTGSY